nr:MAG TPA: hypothetical protein [Caudoviricetes sp.]
MNIFDSTTMRVSMKLVTGVREIDQISGNNIHV